VLQLNLVVACGQPATQRLVFLPRPTLDAIVIRRATEDLKLRQRKRKLALIGTQDECIISMRSVAPLVVDGSTALLAFTTSNCSHATS
jgi:hypothetical protein